MYTAAVYYTGVSEDEEGLKQFHQSLANIKSVYEQISDEYTCKTNSQSFEEKQVRYILQKYT